MYADGSQHTGQWENNKKHGPAVFISDGGRTFEGRFENDVMVGKMGQVTASCDTPLSKHVCPVSCTYCTRRFALSGCLWVMVGTTGRRCSVSG